MHHWAQRQEQNLLNPPKEVLPEIIPGQRNCTLYFSIFSTLLSESFFSIVLHFLNQRFSVQPCVCRPHMKFKVTNQTGINLYIHKYLIDGACLCFLMLFKQKHPGQQIDFTLFCWVILALDSSINQSIKLYLYSTFQTSKCHTECFVQ